MLERFADGRLCDFVEYDPVGLGLVHAQQIGKVPGNSFPFPVGVGGQQDMLRLSGLLLDLFDDGRAPPDIDIFWLEVVLYVHGQPALGQIHHVARRSDDLVFASQEFPDRFGLGWRFHNHQGFSRCHKVPFFPKTALPFPDHCVNATTKIRLYIVDFRQ